MIGIKEVLNEDEVAAFREGGNAIMKKLYTAYHMNLYLYAFKKLGNQEDAEDVTADTLAELWYKRKKMNDFFHIHCFLYQVARNKSVELLRQRKKIPYVCIGDWSIGPATLADCSSLYKKCDSNRLISFQDVVKAIDKLTPKRKRILQLNLIESMPIKLIAQILSVRKQTVYALKDSGLHQLRKALQARF